MAESKLDKWLSGNGLLGGKKKTTTSSESPQKTTKQQHKSGSNNEPTKNKPVKSKILPPKNTK